MAVYVLGVLKELSLALLRAWCPAMSRMTHKPHHERTQAFCRATLLVACTWRVCVLHVPWDITCICALHRSIKLKLGRPTA